MIDYILEYMSNREIFPVCQKEQEELERGISQYLLENGMGIDDNGEYYMQYVSRNLGMINNSDLKLYFIYYPIISAVKQIVIEYQSDESITNERKEALYQMMVSLYKCGLGDRYVPGMEIKHILGNFK